MDNSIFVVVVWLLFVAISLLIFPRLLRCFIGSKVVVFWMNLIFNLLYASSSFFVCWYVSVRKIQLVFFLIGCLFLYLSSEIFLEEKPLKAEKSLSD
ncbi:MAG: hypothetical protein KAS02_02855 [Candidatus Pacebacteria bacterium]|nr:hypothetical protein [Candidatus Paceibacterota bacterium]